jgi:hypothetical protein
MLSAPSFIDNIKISAFLPRPIGIKFGYSVRLLVA